MTGSATEDTAGGTADGGAAACSSFTVAADGSYAARLNSLPGSGAWFPERWTLGGPEPYAVPLPVGQPEEPDSQVLPLADGRVLIARRAARKHTFTLLYPSGPDTGELHLGILEAERVALLPPAPCGRRAYALTVAEDERSSTVWLVAGSASGAPERVATVGGRCSGGAWLDHEGRLLAVDRRGGDGGLPDGPPTKTVVVDLGRDGETSPLLQITDDSNDRLLFADPDSGLLLVRSDAPGEDRLGWGVVGSHRPVRFPDVLHPAQSRLTPFAVQPRQTLLPENCAVALRVDAAHGTWLAVWRPGLRELRHIAAPPGWLTGNGLWTEDGELRVPCSTAHTPCGLARLRVPLPDAGGAGGAGSPRGAGGASGAGGAGGGSRERGGGRSGAAPRAGIPGARTPEPPGGGQGGAPPPPPVGSTPPGGTPASPAAPPPPSSPPPSPPSPPSSGGTGTGTGTGTGPDAGPGTGPDAGPGTSTGTGTGAEAHGPVGTDITSVQHHGHAARTTAVGAAARDAGPPSGAGGFTAGSAVSFGPLTGPGSKPVPLQQAPLTTGTA